jgi:hypothetical protein
MATVPKITLVGMWEKDWLDPKIELFMWKQLCHAFKVDRLVMVPPLLSKRDSVDQYDSIEEALESCEGQRVILEPKGDVMLHNFEHPSQVVYIFGNAWRDNQRIDGVKVRIDTPTMTDMFAINAAAIVLASRL